MSSKFFALAVLLLLPLAAQAQKSETPESLLRRDLTSAKASASFRAEHVRWASSSATAEQREDSHLNQMCDNSSGLCYDVHHFDANKRLIALRLENLNEMKSIRDHAKMNSAAASFVNERINTKIVALEKDRQYLIKLHRASQMQTVKHEITIELAKINAAIIANGFNTRSETAKAKR